ncbi:cell division protein FtsL [Streptococcus agalactiae LMG 14747]|uniref:Cell division protein FtsL n=1 Tax=Streptococcus agalactiae LMG 14747 TaxID=1154860 RepID=V6Z3Z9_STRAG|nr:cell division protein FtsL [Streptococcus agalactiae LMG 14747]
MLNESKREVLTQALQKRIRTFTRIEKAFYGAIVITAIFMAISIIYLQSRNMQVQQEIIRLNSDISGAQTDLNDAKQEVNELSRYERIAKIAKDAGLSIQNDNIQNVE